MCRSVLIGYRWLNGRSESLSLSLSLSLLVQVEVTSLRAELMAMNYLISARPLMGPLLVQGEVTSLRAELATMGAKREAAQRSLEHAASRTDRVMAGIKETEDVRMAESATLERASEEPERAKHAADLLVATVKELHGQEEQLLSQLQQHSSSW